MRFPSLTRFVCLLGIMAASLSAEAYSQAPAPSERPANGSISGRVTISGKRAARVKLVLLAEKKEGGQSRGSTVAGRSESGDSGEYAFTGLSAGRYWVAPADPTFVAADRRFDSDEDKEVLLAADERATGVDMFLKPGGVITGRVLDQAGRPLIDARVAFEMLNDKGRPADFAKCSSTDDRGVYRGYGIPAGRYRVSVGGDNAETRYATRFDRTYSPGVTSSSAAAVINVSAGSTSVADIALGAPNNTFTASGRFVDLDTGQPVPNIPYVLWRQEGSEATGEPGNTSDSLGDFKLGGLWPGQYSLALTGKDPAAYAVESGRFDIVDSDVNGIEIGVRQGASISGRVVVESGSDPAAAAILDRVVLGSFVTLPSRKVPIAAHDISVSADGSFELSGLPPSSVEIFPNISLTPAGFRLISVQMNGIDLHESIQVASGQTLTGVTVVLSYGRGSIHGHVDFIGRRLAPGFWFDVEAVRTGDAPARVISSARVDAAGGFEIDSLPDGVYSLDLSGLPPAKYQSPTVSMTGGKAEPIVMAVRLEELSQ